MSDFYKKGDVIGGKYEVHSTLGKGRFGVVYLVYDWESEAVCALKTFRDEFLVDPAAWEAFQKGALRWVNLEPHPFILAAKWVQEFSGRLFVEMDYVAPDSEGRVNLHDHLRCGRPLAPERAVEWAIQFCLGMEHANAHGVGCHRDIKPANILISQGVPKITDFGLASAAEVAWKGVAARQGGFLVTGGSVDEFGFSRVQSGGKMRCGTPGYMPPEVYRGEPADARSDIYSFGLVLWQMTSGSASPPFVGAYRGDIEAYLREAYEQQMKRRVPSAGHPLSPIIERCVRPDASDRYQDFAALRDGLTLIFLKLTGRVLPVPQVGERSAGYWSNKGASLGVLGRHKEAMRCFDEAVIIDHRNALVWNNRGAALGRLGRHEEAVVCYDKALEIDPRDSKAWFNKGNALVDLGRRVEAIGCYDKSLKIDPRDSKAWNNKGATLTDLCRHEEALGCYNKALGIDPRFIDAQFGKAYSEDKAGKTAAAVQSYGRFLELALAQDADLIAYARKRIQELKTRQDGC
jgi:serine/threonine protein kinase